MIKMAVPKNFQFLFLREAKEAFSELQQKANESEVRYESVLSDVSRNKPRVCAAGAAVIECRRKILDSHFIPSSGIASIFGLTSTENINGLPVASIVGEEFISLFKAVKASQMTGKWDRYPMDLYNNPNAD